MNVTYTFPDRYTPILEKCLNDLGFSLSDKNKLANAVIELSNKYTSTESKTNVWSSKSHCAAYLAYFFPLNYLRVLRTLNQLHEREFWSLEIENWWELGSGSGAAFFAYLDFLNDSKVNILSKIKTANFYDTSNEAHKLFKQILDLNYPNIHINCNWSSEPNIKTPVKKTLFVASYSINEILVNSSLNFSISNLLSKFEHLMIVDSAQQVVVRDLMKLRKQLIEMNYKVWAPCTHQNNCPLLIHSQKDWCFDRFFVQLPNWYYDIEKFLPMKNRTLTYSYWGLSQEAPSPINLDARVIGDTLKEKGKTRQAICRNSDREFLSWLKKQGEAADHSRGSLISTQNLVKVGNELRQN
jgi:ribosomal protein RSM22 (predicted rRNA methylase)